MKNFGLYSQSSTTPIPLKSIDISIQILHNVATTTYTQVYQNNDNNLLETEFFFPISPDACFDSFQAKFNDTTIQGVIKKKEEAKEEYKEAIRKGQTAAYSEINENTGDIMKIMLGNIPPNTEISIKYSYIQKLETSLGKFWCFRLFSSIKARYNSNIADLLNEDVKVLSSYPIISSDDSRAYPWNIQVEIQSPSPIQFLQSPSHELVTTYGNEKHTCTITLSPEKNYYPNKNFILLYSNGKENQTDYVLSPYEDGYCAMVTLVPEFDKKTSLEESYAKLAKAKETPETPTTMDTVRGEYIFLLDRSGSMSGQTIKMAVDSLLLFLKSLPKDSFFNVVSFGSGFNFLYPKSIAYSEKSIAEASKLIKKFDADMGGTEIYRPLSELFDSPANKGYPRFIFLLTDGGVSNTYQVLNLIQANNDKARVFTVGVGSGCSPELITKAAINGRGKHEFVENNHQVYEKVMDLLNASLSPCYSDITLEADNFDGFVKSVSPNPVSLPFLLNNQPVTFFLFIREAAFENGRKMPLKLRFYDSSVKQYRQVEITLEVDQAVKVDSIPKLAIHDMIKRLEAHLEVNSKDLNAVLWMDKADIKESILDLSLKYGVLSKATAFFCKISNNEGLENLQKAQVIVPTIQLEDNLTSFGGAGGYRGGAPGGQFYKQNVVLLNKAYYPEKSAGCCGGGGGGASSSYSRSRTSDVDDKISNAAPVANQGSKAARVCLDVIMKQNFEGYWDHTDKELCFLILKNGHLSEVPKEVAVDSKIAKNAWLTILVMVWLEVNCSDQEKVWKLIHQKGLEWLKSHGVNYEEVKNLGKNLVKEI